MVTAQCHVLGHSKTRRLSCLLPVRSRESPWIHPSLTAPSFSATRHIRQRTDTRWATCPFRTHGAGPATRARAYLCDRLGVLHLLISRVVADHAASGGAGIGALYPSQGRTRRTLSSHLSTVTPHQHDSDERADDAESLPHLRIAARFVRVGWAVEGRRRARARLLHGTQSALDALLQRNCRVQLHVVAADTHEARHNAACRHTSQS